VRPSICCAKSAPQSSLLKHWRERLLIGMKLQRASRNPNVGGKGNSLSKRLWESAPGGSPDPGRESLGSPRPAPQRRLRQSGSADFCTTSMRFACAHTSLPF
jgi:hypothetical protein